MSAPQVLPVEYLASGEHGTIVEVDGNREAVCRLAEIGFQPGVAVRMVQSGRPCIVAIGNHRLTFRGEDAATVLVEVSTGALNPGECEGADGMTTLETLKAGQRARIVEIAEDDAISVRLMEMGLTDGEEIELLCFAPLGDPIEFLVRGYRISLRANEARRVRIEPL